MCWSDRDMSLSHSGVSILATVKNRKQHSQTPNCCAAVMSGLTSKELSRLLRSFGIEQGSMSMLGSIKIKWDEMKWNDMNGNELINYKSKWIKWNDRKFNEDLHRKKNCCNCSVLSVQFGPCQFLAEEGRGNASLSTRDGWQEEEEEAKEVAWACFIVVTGLVPHFWETDWLVSDW